MLRCNKCGNIIYKKPGKMTGSEREGCYICSGKNHYKTKETLQKEVDIKYPNKYQIIGEYVRARAPIKILNLKCGHEYDITPDNLLRGKGCPFCKQSSYENYVDEFMKNHYPSFVKQKKYDDLRGVGGRALSFDYFLPEYNICIEIDGQYHFYRDILPRFESYLNSYNNLTQNDELKNKYCQSHNIPLLRIKYDKVHEIETILKDFIDANSEITQSK